MCYSNTLAFKMSNWMDYKGSHFLVLYPNQYLHN